MEKIYSKVDGRLLHIINRLAEIEGRTDVVDGEHFIQCATLRMENGKTFPPHKHITKERTYKEQIAQESWVIIKGRVRCKFFDIDDTLLAEPILGSGDASFTLYGGHTYEILEDDTIVYEYKTGPYEGQALDKTFLNE
tara:strand:- start:64 stop:477 length:414 start_codon:yes stop_codon:yes gene_type:complete